MEFARFRTEALRPPAKVRILSFRRRGDPAARQIVALVAEARGVTEAQLLQKGRGPAEVALARQLAMYLMHVFARSGSTVMSVPSSAATGPRFPMPAR